MQLINVRSKFHQHYLESKLPDEVNGNSAPKSKARILIALDSMMNQIDENRLSRIHEVNVLCWGRCNIPNMRNNLNDILERESFEVVILHVGTNDTVIRTSDDMIVEIKQLKQYIEISFSSKVIISNIIERIDDGKANLTIKRFNEMLSILKVTIMDNSNITSKYLGKRRLHLTSSHGSGRLAINLISLIRKL